MFTDVHGNNVSMEWQFNASLLEDNEFKHHLEAQWSLYLETDSEHAENPSSFWYHAKTSCEWLIQQRIHEVSEKKV